MMITMIMTMLIRMMIMLMIMMMIIMLIFRHECDYFEGLDPMRAHELSGS